MAHKICNCGNNMWDGDGTIVYDVYFKSDVDDFLSKYPYKEVHFMIKECDESGGSISRKDNSKETEIYNKNNMTEFYKKYGKYYEQKIMVGN